MKYRCEGDNYLVRVEKGEQLISSLIKLVKDEDIQGAWISGLGGSLSAEIGFYTLDEQAYDFKVFDQLLEITSLQGNVSWLNGEPKLHMHGTFSDENMKAIGGHVKELTVGGTCEIILHTFNTKLTRTLDDEVGLPLLDL